MTYVLKILFITAVVFAAVACSSSKSTIPTDITLDDTIKGDDAVIERDKFADLKLDHAHDIIRTLHPEWLQDSEGARDEKKVYVNGDEKKYLVLGTIPASNIARLSYLNPRMATEKYGEGHSNGAILITTFRKDIGSGRDRDIITREEFLGGLYNNAYEIIERLRPSWLRKRELRVYINDTEESIGYLRLILPQSIGKIEYFDNIDYRGRAIVVTLFY